MRMLLLQLEPMLGSGLWCACRTFRMGLAGQGRRRAGIFSGGGVYGFIQPPRKEITMSASRLTLVALAIAAALTATAHADTGKTREQVRAELAEAVRNGDVMAAGESGLTLRQMFPQRYPQAAVAGSGVTRAQVLGEVEEARRNGTLIAAGEAGQPVTNPQTYPTQFAGKTRAQVEAETREAIRTGNILAGGESSLLLKDAYPERYANIRPAADGPMQAQAQTPASGTAR
jgi:hypothetical protein